VFTKLISMALLTLGLSFAVANETSFDGPDSPNPGNREGNGKIRKAEEPMIPEDAPAPQERVAQDQNPDMIAPPQDLTAPDRNLDENYQE